MIQVIYNEVEDAMILRAEGHAGFAEKGKDIVCAAVSVLMQTLAYSVDAGNTGNTFELSDGKNGNRLTVQAPMSVLNRDKFDLVVEGLIRLAENYPENVQFKKLCTKSVNVMDLQMFAEVGEPLAGRKTLLWTNKAVLTQRRRAAAARKAKADRARKPRSSARRSGGGRSGR